MHTNLKCYIPTTTDANQPQSEILHRNSCSSLCSSEHLYHIRTPLNIIALLQSIQQTAFDQTNGGGIQFVVRAAQRSSLDNSSVSRLMCSFIFLVGLQYLRPSVNPSVRFCLVEWMWFVRKRWGIEVGTFEDLLVTEYNGRMSRFYKE